MSTETLIYNAKTFLVSLRRCLRVLLLHPGVDIRANKAFVSLAAPRTLLTLRFPALSMFRIINKS